MAKRAKKEMMSACMTPHAMMHSVFGLGLGLLLAGLLPGLAGTNAFLLGGTLAVASFFADWLLSRSK